jgi:uncharacterized membrane protein
MFAPDKPLWWDAPNPPRILTAIGVALILGFRIYGIYQSSKNTRRPARVRRIERIVALSLWSFIAVSIILLFLFHRA